MFKSTWTHEDIHTLHVSESHQVHTGLELDPLNNSEITAVLEEMSPWIRDLNGAVAPLWEGCPCAPLPSSKGQGSEAAMAAWGYGHVGTSGGSTGTQAGHTTEATCPSALPDLGSLHGQWRETEMTLKRGSCCKASERRPRYLK